jgi:hypothetical protein
MKNWAIMGFDKHIACSKCIVVTYEIRVFFEGAQKEVFSSIFLKRIIKIQRLENWPLYQVFSSIF